MTSGNIPATRSDDLPQFLFSANVLSKASGQTSNIHERDWLKFIQTDFILDYFEKNWSDVLQLDQQDVNVSIESFLENMNSIFDKHAPLNS